MKSVRRPSAATIRPMPFTRKSSAPEARKTPIATRMAMRYGMILTATENPSLAPSMNASYTLIRRKSAIRMNAEMTPKRVTLATTLEIAWIRSCGRPLK